MATKYKLLNGEHIELVGDELAEHEEAVRLADISETASREAEAQKATDKAAGNQKLLDLGLSQAEVDALTK
jgi:hypothetical protein